MLKNLFKSFMSASSRSGTQAAQQEDCKHISAGVSPVSVQALTRQDMVSHVPFRIAFFWEGEATVKSHPFYLDACYRATKLANSQDFDIEVLDSTKVKGLKLSQSKVASKLRIPLHKQWTKIKSAKLRTDYVRLWYMYHFGGVWMDMDTVCLSNIKSLMPELERENILVIWRDDDTNTPTVNTSFFIATPGHSILRDALRRVHDALDSDDTMLDCDARAVSHLAISRSIGAPSESFMASCTKCHIPGTRPSSKNKEETCTRPPVNSPYHEVLIRPIEEIRPIKFQRGDAWVATRGSHHVNAWIQEHIDNKVPVLLFDHSTIPADFADNKTWSGRANYLEGALRKSLYDKSYGQESDDKMLYMPNGLPCCC